MSAKAAGGDHGLRLRSGSGDGFSLGELEANFHIVNHPDLIVEEVTESPGPEPGRLVHRFDGHLISSVTMLGPPVPGDAGAAPVVSEVAIPAAANPDGAVPSSTSEKPGRAGQVRLLRGRNVLELHRGAAGDPLVFPVFYKTPTRDWIESILKAFVVLILIQFFVVQTFFIPTSSMRETLLPGDYIMVEKVSYLFRRPARGDVVIFQYPQDPRKDFIKRMVARAGDRVEVDRKQLFVNGVRLQEPYAIHRDDATDFGGRPAYRYDRDFFRPRVVPADTLFVMGDNRDESMDSRMWGFLPHFRVKGRGFVVYYPFRRAGLIRHERGPFQGLQP